MTKNIIQDGANPRKQKLENSNSEEVKGFQRNSEIWNNGHEAGAQYGIELTVFELMKGLSKNIHSLTVSWDHIGIFQK